MMLPALPVAGYPASWPRGSTGGTNATCGQNPASAFLDRIAAFASLPRIAFADVGARPSLAGCFSSRFLLDSLKPDIAPGISQGTTRRIAWRIEITLRPTPDPAQPGKWAAVDVTARLKAPSGSSFEISTIRLVRQAAP